MPGPETSVMAVDVRTTPATVEAGAPRPLFQARLASIAQNIGPNVVSRIYEVTRDGQRFLALSTPPGRHRSR